MVRMDVISVDSSGEGSLFILDETPIMEEVSSRGCRPRRKKKQQKKPTVVVHPQISLDDTPTVEELTDTVNKHTIVDDNPTVEDLTNPADSQTVVVKEQEGVKEVDRQVTQDDALTTEEQRTNNDQPQTIQDQSLTMEETSESPTKNTVPKKKKPNKKRKKKSLPPKKNPVPSPGHVIFGGTITDDSPAQRVKPARKKRKTNSIETIVIEDDADSDSDIEVLSEEDNVIELSDDEKVGVIGGLLHRSVNYHTIQHKLNDFQKLFERNKRAPNNNYNNNRPLGEVEPYHCPKPPGCASKQLAKNRKLRPIIIDGSNVAFGHGNRACFSTRGIELCWEYFKRRGHTVKVFIPQFRRRHPATRDTHILDRLEAEKVIVFTPSRKVNGKTIMSYDDRMMVEYAAQCGGVIVTRDNLQDLLHENDTFKEVINERLLMFTWVDEDIIMFPQDPLGRKGPKLDEFLSFPAEENESTPTTSKEIGGRANNKSTNS